MIFPKRVVFSGTKRVYDLNLANIGEDTARYNISIVQIRMKEEGSFENIIEPDSGQYFANSYFRFYPRNVILAPKESQTVKIQLIRSDEMKPGEYRSHLYFRAIPISKPLASAEDAIANETSSAITIKIRPIFGLTIPVIIRMGENTTKVTFSDLSIKIINDTTATLAITIKRNGNMSVYGDISANYISPEGKVTEVLNIQGVAVYTPNTIRRAILNLEKVTGVDYREGKLHLIYKLPNDDKNILLAEAELILK